MRYIYLHGFCSGPATFKGNYFRGRFADQAIELTTPDLNGGDFEHLTVSSQLTVVRALLAASEEPATLIGSSMGGYLACLLAQESDIVERLILIAPAFGFLRRYQALLGDEALRSWRETGWIEVDHYQYGEKRRLGYDIMEDAQRYESLSLARPLPTLIFHGLYDDTVPYQASVDYLQVNPHAELLLLPSDHSLNAEIDRLWHYTSGALGLDTRITDR